MSEPERLFLGLKTFQFRIILITFKGFFKLKIGKLPHRAIEVLPTPASPSIINLNLWSYCLFIVILDSMRWFLSDFFFHDIILFFSFSLEAHHFNSSKNTEYSWYRGVVGGGTKKVHNKCVFKIGDNIFSEQQKLAEALFFNFRSIFLKDYVTTLWFDEK